MRIMPIDTNLNIVRDGLIAWYDVLFQTSYPDSGTTWYDLSGNDYNGTLVNGVGYDSANGGTLTFDGSNDHIQLGTASKFLPSPSQTTIEVWLKPDVINVYRKIFTTMNSGSSAITGIYFSQGSSPYKLYFGLKTSTTQAIIVYNTDISTTNYSHIVCTYNNPTAKIYINGALVVSGSIGGTIGTGGIARISGYDNGSEIFDGNIGSFRIYSKALSADEITHNYKVTKGRFI